MKLVRITDDCVEDSEKELIWIFGGMHAFENPGRLSAKGMIDFFVSDHSSAKRLRKEAIIYIVPMMDVDQIFNGGSGKDQNPKDFNRDWGLINSPSNWNAVNAAKKWIDSTAQLNNFSVFFDAHSPPPSHSNANLFYYIYEEDHHLSNTSFVTESIQYLGNYQGTELLYTGLYNGISQDYVLLNYDNPEHYNVTMEVSFNKRIDGVTWTKELYELNGQYHAQAISDYIHGLPIDNDIIIGNNDSTNVVLNGNWLSDTSKLGYLGDNYIVADTQTPASAIFSTTIDTAGTYEVFTRWVSDSSFATNARASLNHAGITTDYIIDMSLRGGNWVTLDTFNLGAGEQISLTISNIAANGTVIADGLRISKVMNCETVAIQELQPEETPFKFNLYPNPTKNQFLVQLENNARLDNGSVYDMLGNLVLSFNKPIVNTSALSKGLYIVKVKTNQGQGVKKLIIK